MNTRWAIYLAICVGYTIAVFGLAWSDGKIPLFLAGRAGSTGGVIQVHVVFLLGLILWIWLAQSSKPFLPDWVVAEGNQHGSWYLVFALLELSPYCFLSIGGSRGNRSPIFGIPESI